MRSGVISYYYIMVFSKNDIFFINKQFRTCTNAFPNEFTVRSYEYCSVHIEILLDTRKSNSVVFPLF